MAVSDMKKVRNFGIFAHIDAGKTTISERILYYTGKIHKIGEVHEGAAVMDWMKQEQERGITITAATTYVQWNGFDLHLIDTPGHVDFTVEVERSLRVLDGVVLVLDAVAGVQPQTETIWRQAIKYKVPILCFVNKMDRIGANFNAAIESLSNKLDAKVMPLVVPIGAESDFRAVIDLVEGELVSWKEVSMGAEVVKEPVPADMEGLLEAGRDRIMETLSDFDDEVAEAYLEGKKLAKDELVALVRKHTINGDVIPVLCGTALKNKGVQMILDAVTYYLPSPLEVPPMVGVHPTTLEPELRKPLVTEPFSALAFKIQQDSGRKLTYIRVYSGVYKGGRLFNATRNKVEKPAAILSVHADKKDRVEEARAGDILALTGLKFTITGDTLCDQEHPLLLETISFAKPVISMAIEPKYTQDEDKLNEVLARLQEEDPTFKVETNEETGQTIVSGMGELHLEVLLTRVETEFNVGVHVGKPQVVYKETVKGEGKKFYEFDRMLGDKRHKALAEIAVRPAPRGEGNSVVINPKIPETFPQFAKIVEAGVTEGLACGPMSFQVDDVVVEVLRLEGEEGSMSEMAVKVAVGHALREASAMAGSLRLEPIMEVIITVPEENLGEVIGDLNSRRGEVQSVASNRGVAELTAFSSLRSMFGYSTDLRSLTQGRGTFTMTFKKYDTSTLQ